MQAHGNYTDPFHGATVAIVAGQAAEDVAKHPGNDGGDQQQADGPGHSAGNQLRDRCRKGRE